MGSTNPLHKRFCRWAKSGVWDRIFESLINDADNEYVMIDSTLAAPTNRLRREKGDPDQALGRSRGGLTTKVHLLADAQGRPLRLLLTPGQVHSQI
jgi:transposase